MKIIRAYRDLQDNFRATQKQILQVNERKLRNFISKMNFILL